ncbi:MAG: sugar ABC transporter substrate-binding protein [Lachnospiraceae bacterium]|nr:sugar ABC transporter substrate-binding protein [Lachnospiraceae bacterium]
MKKKLAAMTLAMAMAVTSLAGCGVQTTEEAGEAPAAETTSDTTTTEMTGTGDKEINILIYAQEHEKAVYEDLIAEFTKEHADEISKVNFEVTTQDEYGVKMTAAMTADDMPDIFYIGPDSVRSYVDNGYALPLDGLVDQAAVDNLWPAIKSAYMYDGKEVGKGSLYCLPKDLSCFAFAYNQDLFDEAGLEYPDPQKPYTYEEFLDVCKKLTKDKDGDGEIDQWGVANANAFGMTPYLYSNGARFLTDNYTKVNLTNNPQLKEAFQYYVDLTAKEGVTPTVEQDTALGGYQRWLDGQIAFYACGTWDVAAFMDDATFPYKWNLCGWPVGPSGDGKSTAWLGTVGFAVSSKTQYPELCAQLIQKLSTDEEGQKVLCGETTGKSLQIPNIMDYAQTTFKEKVNDGTIPYASNVDVIFGYIEGNDKYNGIFSETTYTYNAEWWDTFLEGIPNVQTGSISVDDYFKEVEPKMQAALDNAIELQNAATNN